MNITVIIVFVLILIIYGAFNFYIGRKLFSWGRFLFPRMNGIVFTIIFSIPVVALMSRFIPLPSTLKTIVELVGFYWMGAFVYLFLLFVATDVLLLLLRIVKIIPSPVPATVQFYLQTVIVLLTIGVVTYGSYHATQIKHTSYTIEMNESKRATNMKIVVISDLHLGAIQSEKRLPTIVKEINALQPDVVCIVGDIFNDDYAAIQQPEKASNLFKSISSTYGVYAVLGNHDGGETLPQMVRFLEKSNVMLLRDEYTIIDNHFALFGRLDGSPIGGYGNWQRQDIQDQIKAIDPEMPIVVMDHTPNKLDEYNEKVDLIVSGHTHKGQLFPANLITNAVFEVDYGHYQRNESSPHIIVSSGVGTWGMPMRIGSNNEIVTITLNE